MPCPSRPPATATPDDGGGQPDRGLGSPSRRPAPNPETGSGSCRNRRRRMHCASRTAIRSARRRSHGAPAAAATAGAGTAMSRRRSALSAIDKKTCPDRPPGLRAFLPQCLGRAHRADHLSGSRSACGPGFRAAGRRTRTAPPLAPSPALPLPDLQRPGKRGLGDRLRQQRRPVRDADVCAARGRLPRPRGMVQVLLDRPQLRPDASAAARRKSLAHLDGSQQTLALALPLPSTPRRA
ncbi:hypothetical protein M2282_005235 [Variovorax boronicumulans]|nr:hypothetical protein [Variovorax boronicumulans]